jgi:hypothetical protein
MLSSRAITRIRWQRSNSPEQTSTREERTRRRMQGNASSKVAGTLQFPPCPSRPSSPLSQDCSTQRSGSQA